MRYGVIGSRTFLDYAGLCGVLDPQKKYITQIISGGAKGADFLGARWAKENNKTLVEFLPNYALYGKKAPFIRNKLIVDSSDIIIAFWNGQSRGTAHALNYAKAQGIKSIVYSFLT